MFEIAAIRTGLRNAFLESIAELGATGAFRPDRAAVGRHTQIMMRFERVLEEFGDEPADMAEICRYTGTSRRSLEAVVRQRLGRSPWEYLRWRRLWRARALLDQPTAETTVTDVAFGLGFWHLGRFAAAYASTFGESPSGTLHRVRGMSVA
jgi:transcriptional regulator GlxA family with amidase domain